MNYGFLIDNRKCIGCHACSTACKSENEVPLGVYRTWVKTVERGSYPDVKRSFHVTRCNHCENPPCVRICPTTAMYQRDDGIVEFDGDNCIGCKSCVQACPYDAIYIDPETNTAAKCHYCSHRVDIGLEPACVVVCPTHAIVAGDLDDASSEISLLAARHRTTVRKPEQGTAPKLLYIDGDGVALHPTAFAEGPSAIMASADVVTEQGVCSANFKRQNGRYSRSGESIRRPQKQGLPPSGPLQVGGKRADHMAQLAYNAQHRMPWHWPVPAYLLTKGIAAGVFLFFALGQLLNVFPAHAVTFLIAGAIGIAATIATTALLVLDLEKPSRFYYILLHPQWKSWLTRGAFILTGFALVSTAWWLLELLAFYNTIALPDGVRTLFMWLTWPLALGTAVYTAFLFAQAEGRDLWQSPTLPTHLTIQAITLGGAVVAALDFFAPLPITIAAAAEIAFSVGLVLSLGIVVLGEIAIPHASEVAARAALDIKKGRYRIHFWLGAIGLGHVVPLALIAGTEQSVFAACATVAAIIGLYIYEHVFVMAPQRVPNS